MALRTSALVGVGLLLLGPLQAAETSWLDARAAIEELAEAGEYSAALKLEDEFLELVSEAFGDPSPELAGSYLYTASIHAALRDFTTAESRILSSLERYEAIDGSLATRLIDPFVALGDNYHLAGNFALALGAYDEARSLIRRAYGLLSETQLDVLNRMSESALGLGQAEEAIALQTDALTMVQRARGEDSLEFLEANYRYAAWLGGRGAFYQADLHYHRMYSLVRRHFDDDDWLRLRLLRVDADNFRRANGLGTGHRYKAEELNDALKIAQSLEDPDPVLIAEIYLDLGDWYVTFQRGGSVEDNLALAWQQLETVPNRDALREQWFSELVVVQAAPFWSYLISGDPDDPWGRVEIEFTIGTDGSANDVYVVASEPPGLMDEAAIRQVLNSRYRPRMKDGQVVESTARVGFDYQYSEL